VNRPRRRGRSWRWSTSGVLGASLVLLVVGLSLLAPILSPYDPTRDRNLSLRLQPPSAEHRLGTDEIGRDLLRRVWHGGRVSLGIGLGALIIALTVGATIGLWAGYAGGWVDRVAMAAIDVLMAFPGILLAIAIVAVLGPNLSNTMLAIGVTQVPDFARIVRASVLSLRTQEFVVAAEALGAHSPRVILRHLLPNSLSPLLVQGTLAIGSAILSAASLGFLGLGVSAPHPEWGAMIRDGYSHFLRAPWLSLAPGAAIYLTVIGFNLLGDALRDNLDPRTRVPSQLTRRSSP